MIQKILKGKNNNVLRSKNQDIRQITLEIHTFIQKMFAAMQKAQGIGLAAPQVGENLNIFVVDPQAFDVEKSKWEFEGIEEPDLSDGYVFINPRISTFPKPYEKMVEGCLSLPGWEGRVKRSKRINIKAQNEKGERFKLKAKGLLAKALEHEYDHLKGILICDKWENARPTKGIRTADRYGKVLFFGSPPYGDIVLKTIQKAGFHPLIIHKGELETLKKSSYELGILAAYGEIIPESLIKKFRKGILNIHPSLLPRYRGPSPVQQTLLNGDSMTGVTIIKLTLKTDAGPIVAQKEFPIDKRYTTGELSTILFQLGGALLLEIISPYLKGKIELISQDETKASYTSLVTKETARLDWTKEASLIAREVRAYQPWPYAYTFFEHHGKKMRLQILEAEVIDTSLPHTVCGSVEKKDGQLVIHCAKGNLLTNEFVSRGLKIKKLRPEGKKEMSGEEFLRGYTVERLL